MNNLMILNVAWIKRPILGSGSWRPRDDVWVCTDETANYMHLPIDLSHALMQELAKIRKNEPELMPYLRLMQVARND
jgi:hypothetical protein